MAAAPGKKAKRVLVLGDSLVAGFYDGGSSFHPFTKALGRALKTKKKAGAAAKKAGGAAGKKSSTTPRVVVASGHCGALAAELAAGGLLPELLARAAKLRAPFACVALFAGTNDLCGVAGAERADPRAVAAALESLAAAAKTGGARAVLVLLPLPRGRPEGAAFRARRLALADALRQRAAGGAFDLVDTAALLIAASAAGAPNTGAADAGDQDTIEGGGGAVPAGLPAAFCDPDGVHLSPAGYDALGRALAPEVRRALAAAAPARRGGKGGAKPKKGGTHPANR